MTKPDWNAHIENLTKAEDRLGDEDLGRLICDLRGTVWSSAAGLNLKWPDEFAFYSNDETVWGPFDKRPDVDLTAVRALVREVLPGWKIQSGDDYEIKMCDLTLWSGPGGHLSNSIQGEHPTSETLANLIALCRAKKAEAET